MHQLTKKISLVLCCANALLSASVWADADIVYRWTDKNGSIHYSPTKPYGVQYETIDTSFSAVQRDMIKNSEREKAMRDYEQNKDKILAQKEKERNALIQRIQICLDILADKQEYQKRRIIDQAVKDKFQCEAKYHKEKQKAQYDQCVLMIENRKMLSFNKFDENYKNCYNDDTPPDVIDAAMKKHLENRANSSNKKDSRIRDKIRENANGKR